MGSLVYRYVIPQTGLDKANSATLKGYRILTVQCTYRLRETYPLAEAESFMCEIARGQIGGHTDALLTVIHPATHTYAQHTARRQKGGNTEMDYKINR
jgi:hypothetical protein